MALESLVEDTRRSIWHAFTALAKGEEREVAKSSLKALINNIGQARGSEKAEEMIGEGTTDKLSFTDYFTVILNQVLLPDDSDSALAPCTCAKIDQICWLFCEAFYQKDSRLSQGSFSLNTDDLFKLWKVFNFLVKVDLDSTEDTLFKATLPLRVDVEEAYRIGSLIQQAVGFSPCECGVVDPTEDNRDKPGVFSLDFVQFINTICMVTNGLSSEVLREGLDSVMQQILCDVMKKGFLEKFGNQLTAWKRRWFRLSAEQLEYFTSDLEQEMKGSIEINKTLRLENLPQRPGHKQFRFKLHAPNKTFELAAPDLRTKNEWLVALQKVSDHVGDGSIQRSDLLTRERARQQRRKKVEEELFAKQLMRQELQSRDQQLEHELLVLAFLSVADERYSRVVKTVRFQSRGSVKSWVRISAVFGELRVEGMDFYDLPGEL